MNITKEQIKRVYALGAGLGLVDNRNHDGDMLHELVHGITGKTSIAELTATEFNSVQRELLERMRLKNQTPPLPRRKKPVQEAPAADMMTAEQQSLAWRLVYRLAELDKDPKLHEDGTAVSVGERMSGAITKILRITPNMKEPFRWVDFESGTKLIETLKRYVVSAEKKAGVG